MCRQWCACGFGIEQEDYLCRDVTCGMERGCIKSRFDDIMIYFLSGRCLMRSGFSPDSLKKIVIAIWVHSIAAIHLICQLTEAEVSHCRNRAHRSSNRTGIASYRLRRRHAYYVSQTEKKKKKKQPSSQLSELVFLKL